MTVQPSLPRESSRRTLLALASGLALAAVGAVALVIWTLGLPYRRAESKLALGLSEAQVRERFGEPYRIYDAASAPEDYYVKGWTRRERPITSKVWIFFVGEPICYVWFDEEGGVEDWFLGGS